jgi:hypothetical protein
MALMDSFQCPLSENDNAPLYRIKLVEVSIIMRVDLEAIVLG